MPSDESGILLKEDFAVILLPVNTIGVELSVKVFEDGNVFDVCKSMDLQDVRTAFRMAEEGYIDENDTFVLTEKGKAYAEQL